MLPLKVLDESLPLLEVLFPIVLALDQKVFIAVHRILEDLPTILVEDLHLRAVAHRPSVGGEKASNLLDGGPQTDHALSWSREIGLALCHGRVFEPHLEVDLGLISRADRLSI